MKKIGLGLLIFFLCTRLAHARFGADISLQQDSLNPYIFTATIRVLNYLVFDFEKDSLIVIWDNLQKKVPLFDTFIEPFYRSVCIYKDTYTFAQTDSGVKITGVYLSQRPDGIYNIANGQAENLPFYIEARLNLDVLKTKLGAKSLTFNSDIVVYDTVGNSIFLSTFN